VRGNGRHRHPDQDHPSARLGHAYDLIETPQHQADTATSD
jgi:hypothetical protein